MSLTGNRIVIFLPAEELREIFGNPALSKADGGCWFGEDHEIITVGGMVTEETPAIGVWLQLETAYNERGADVRPNFFALQVPHLFNWSRLRNGRLLGSTPMTDDMSKPVIGFRPRS